MPPAEPVDCFLPAPVWDRVFAAEDASNAGAFLYLWALADQDGVAPVDPAVVDRLAPCGGSGDPDGATRQALGALAACGLLVHYVDLSGASWAWLPDVPAYPPVPSLRRPATDRPAPPADAVAEVLRARLGRDPTDAEVRAAFPRASGGSRPASGTGGADADVRLVWDAWVRRQPHPDACRLGPPAIREVRAALTQATAAHLAVLLDYVFEADEPGPRFLRERGLTTLPHVLVADKLQGRVQLALAWRDRRAPPPSGSGGSSDPGVTLGPLAAFRGKS